jgi:beta-N-acetylhexosaminidase
MGRGRHRRGSELHERASVRHLLLAALPLLLVAVPATQVVSAVPTVQAPPAPVPVTLALAPAAAEAPVDPDDPARWSDRRLAAQLVLAGYDMTRTDDALPAVREGLGGVVLFGTPPADLGTRLQRLRAAGAVVPLVASDEEGGRVQRLDELLGALPSAESLGRTHSPAQVQALAAGYAAGMAGLGVDMGLAPVADLAVAGYYIERTDRAFSADPHAAGAYASAWSRGLRGSGVVPVAKHWPGHGAATDSHAGPASAPPLSTLEQRDLLAFADVLAAGVPAVMVGHLRVPGLTEGDLPATLSPAAYRYLRGRAGAQRLLMTDSMSMRAVTAGGRTTAQAAVQALAAGADMVLVDPGPGPRPVVDAVAAALADGRYPRAAGVASVRRVLHVKRTVNVPAVPADMREQGLRRFGLRTTLSALVDDPVGGVLTARWFVRDAGSPTWNVANGGMSSAVSGERASYRLGPGHLRPAQRYEWAVRACNDAGVCSPLSPVRRFATRPA